MRKIQKAFKALYLRFRAFKLWMLAGLTSSLRKKKFDRESTRSVLVISLKRVGDAVLSIPTFRAIKQSLPKSQVTVFASSYISDILERIPEVDAVVPYKKDSSFLKKAKQLRKLAYNAFDLAVDLTCDHTLEAAWLAWLSKAKFRVGYDTWKRGFLFNQPAKHEAESIHAAQEILNIVRSIGLEAKDQSLAISAAQEEMDTVQKYLRKKGVKDKDLLVGIHPGGYYPTQRWLTERFAELAEQLIARHKAHIILMGGPAEEDILRQVAADMTSQPLIFLDQPLSSLLALLQTCHLLICNNSGPLHMAAALGTPTVSTMGPTLPERWWPQGEGNIVIRKDLPCTPCNEGRCRLKTLDCMRAIEVKDMYEAAELQLSRMTRMKK